MPRELKISIGQYSDRGAKEANQDFHGAMIPGEPTLGLKGVAIALADGISSSEVSRVASESAVKGFLTDYYCTSDSWSVKTSAQRVISATNSWLHGQTRRIGFEHDRDKGYVCTLTVMVLKSATAHILHVGDARVYRVSGNALEQLTEDHRVVVSSQETFLGRALGMNPRVEIDYQAIAIEAGDLFVMATDGVYEHVEPRFVIQAIGEGAADLDGAARRIADRAFERGSTDNLTVQIVRVDALPDGEAAETLAQTADLPLPPLLEPRQIFDGYRILREVHASSRSHLYLAVDTEGPEEEPVILKTPSIDLRGDEAYLKRFMMEEWVARRLDNAHVLKPRPRSRRRGFLYVVTEYVEGRTLAQWMIDNPRPDLETVRGIVGQIASGLQAFHRKEMLHQDLRPANVMIDRTGTVKIIDFGSTRVSGIAEADPGGGNEILGTAQYTAPEYFLGEGGTPRSDLYSLGVIAYQMVTGRLPYGARMAQARTRFQQGKVAYASALDETREIPAWVDGALRKAVHPDPARRYDELFEFVHDLRHPNGDLLDSNPSPLLQRNPLLFWKGLSFALAATLLLMLAFQYGRFR
jgi:serine/threonine protein phosphatase PrpC